MCEAADFLIKQAILSIKLNVPKPIATAMAAGMEQQRQAEPGVHDPEGYVEMPSFESLAAMRRRNKQRRLRGGAK